MLWKGFKFGLLLQIAVGPMCVMVFNTAATQGFAQSMAVVLAVAFVDAAFIALSALGVAALLRRERVQLGVRVAGCAVLVLFGANILLSAFGVTLLPALSLFSGSSGGSLFVQGLLMTASNPLTIVFWSGVFAAQVAENQLAARQLAWFGAGCVLSTLSFLTAVGVLGSLLSDFLPAVAVRALNAAVGLALIWFGLSRLRKK